VDGCNLLSAIEASIDAEEANEKFDGGRTLRGKESLNTGNECFSESQTM
jgi:hypothetical protein